MINERDIAEKFSVLWRRNFPLLSPNFIRMFNETQVETVNSNQVNCSEEVRYDLIAEAAFLLSETLVNNRISLSEFLSQKNSFLDLAVQTKKTIGNKGGFLNNDVIFTKYEVQEIQMLSRNTIDFIQNSNGEDICFRPKLIGYNIISDLEGDLSIDDTLYEIKTVTRKFKSSDLKQLFIYLALRQVSGKKMWKYGGLYNPRKGTLGKFNVKKMIYDLTGGKSTNEAFEDLLNGLVREVEFDSKF